MFISKVTRDGDNEQVLIQHVSDDDRNTDKDAILATFSRTSETYITVRAMHSMFERTAIEMWTNLSGGIGENGWAKGKVTAYGPDGRILRYLNPMILMNAGFPIGGGSGLGIETMPPPSSETETLTPAVDVYLDGPQSLSGCSMERVNPAILLTRGYPVGCDDPLHPQSAYWQFICHHDTQLDSSWTVGR